MPELNPQQSLYLYYVPPSLFPTPTLVAKKRHDPYLSKVVRSRRKYCSEVQKYQDIIKYDKGLAPAQDTCLVEMIFRAKVLLNDTQTAKVLSLDLSVPRHRQVYNNLNSTIGVVAISMAKTFGSIPITDYPATRIHNICRLIGSSVCPGIIYCPTDIGEDFKWANRFNGCWVVAMMLHREYLKAQSSL